MINLNLQSLAKNDALDQSMWRDCRVRHLLPDYARWNSFVGGGVDGLVEEALGIPLLLKTIGEVCIDEQKQQALRQVFTKEGMSKLGTALVEDVLATLADPDRRNHAITKASVEALFLYYALATAARKSLETLVDKATDLAKKLDRAPLVRKRVAELVKIKDKAKIKQLNQLLETVDPTILERIASKVEPEKVGDLLDDLANNKSFREALVQDEFFVNAWKVLEGNPILRKKPENLENISKWLDEGIEPQKLTDGIAKSKSKQNLIDELGTAQSKLHAQVLIKDYDNIPGVAKGRYVSNGSSIMDKASIPNGWKTDVDLPSDEVKNFTGKVDPLELKSGDKIYRVSHANGAGGAYWTRTKPNRLDDVVGGTAVQPEWNNFQYLHEYTVPDGVTIKTWSGKAARQQVSETVPSNYHLPGGDEQLFINYIGKQDPNFQSIVKSFKAEW